MPTEIVAGRAEARSPQEGKLLFWGIQSLAFLSVLIPSGPSRPEWYFAALGLTAAVAVSRWVTPWARVPARFQVIPLLLATAGIGWCKTSNAAPGSMRSKEEQIHPIFACRPQDLLCLATRIGSFDID